MTRDKKNIDENDGIEKSTNTYAGKNQLTVTGSWWTAPNMCRSEAASLHPPKIFHNQ
jgi:hypothetical protein